MNTVSFTRLLAKSVVASLLLVSCNAAAPSVKWIEGAPDSKGKAVHTIEICGAKALPADWTIWFSVFPERISAIEGSDAAVEEYQANVHRITPTGVFGDTLRVMYKANALKRHGWAPEGFVLQTAKGNKPLKVAYDFLPLAPDGEKWVSWNASKTLSEPAASKIIPLPKNKVAEVRPRGWYKLTIGETAVIEAEDPDGEYYAGLTLDQLRANYGGSVPPMTIEDWPDYQYRGFMMDVSRCFVSKETLLELIDVLSRYKLNVLHLHLGDDEGWRLEIDGIPELTSVGAFHSLDFEKTLQPSYDGCADPAARNMTNGFYSRADFIEILRYAADHHIAVIPEFDTPGHARAAIKSMQAYEKRTGDASMRLQDPTDDSKYYTAQGYTDNVMNVELESVYTFIGKVFDSIISMYAEAGVELPAIHIGGDEVPAGAWHGDDRHEFYLGRVARLALEKGIKISGWQEIAGCKNPKIAELLRSVTYSTNVWVTIGPYINKPYEIADMGFPVIQSNCEYTYADQAYSDNKEEQAHSWVRYIDDIEGFKFPLKEYPNIIGVQAQLWGETVRSWDDLCYDLFPKTIGVFERAWNRKPICTEDEFYSLIVWREMPYWDSKGINYHIPQPGLQLVDGTPVGNSAIPGAEIQIWEDSSRIYARTLFRSHPSVTTTILK